MDKVAILIDGGYFLKRLPSVSKDVDTSDPKQVANCISRLVTEHLKRINKIAKHDHARSLLYRVFYYDALPYLKKEHLPISKHAIDYSKTPEAKFRLGLFDELRRRSSTAVRLGEVRKDRSWILKEEPQKALLKGAMQLSDLKDQDFAPALRQKAVDMRIGVDITSLSLKKQVGTIVLLAGDSDFVPAAKLARREGVKIILDPMWRSVSDQLFEHIDGVASGLPSPNSKR